jgi:hypothetical protein
MEFARIKATLQKNGIKYDAKTTCSENLIARRFNAAAAARFVQPYSAASVQTYIYYIYVKPSDYKKAKELAYSKKI